jgi:hypothetical protein
MNDFFQDRSIEATDYLDDVINQQDSQNTDQVKPVSDDQQNISPQTDSSNQATNPGDPTPQSPHDFSSQAIVNRIADQNNQDPNQTQNPTLTPVSNQNNVSTNVVNFDQAGKVEDEKKPVKKGQVASVVLKILLLFIIPLMVAAGVGFYFYQQKETEIYVQDNKILLSVPMQDVNWQDLGVVFEPIITLPIKTQSGFERWEFLLDSGAVVSSLPRDWADKMGKDIAFLKRSTFRGFGGKTSLAYHGDMEVLLGDEEV